MKLKAVFRWVLRRDAEASGTRMGGWITRLEGIIPVLFGVQYGWKIGLAVFIFMTMARMFVGYLDIRYFRVSEYTAAYITSKAPASVIVIKKKKK